MNCESPSSTSPGRHWRLVRQCSRLVHGQASCPWRPAAILLVILLLAALLRLPMLTQAPPGLNQDEAANAWNAYCLLKTGRDQVGVTWPVFYSRCLGANRSTLQLYLLMPLQAIGGLNVWTTRLPCALGGVITVWLLYVVGARMFGLATGLVAAGLLAVNPWHVQLSRLGHEAGMSPLLVMIPLALLLWARLPLTDDTGPGRAGLLRPRDRRHWRTSRQWHPRMLVAALAGAVGGVCCYGYQAVRIFLPVFLTLCVVVNWRAWRDCFRTRAGAGVISLALITGALTFGPLAWKHLVDPEGIAKRSQATWAWDEGDSPAKKVWSVLARYPAHFGLDYLFVRGDRYGRNSAPGTGAFHWYMLPLMAWGLVVVVRRGVFARTNLAANHAPWEKSGLIDGTGGQAASGTRAPGVKISRRAGRSLCHRSVAARVLLAWVIVYPAADCLNVHVSVHALRSSPGLCGLVLLGAVGAVSAAGWLLRRYRDRSRTGLWIAAGVCTLVVIQLNVRFLVFFFGDYNRHPATYYGYHADLLAASEWLRPRFDEVDAVFCTTQYINRPYITTLVGLQYDPRRWFDDVRTVRTPGEWDVYIRYGKMHFLHARLSHPAIKELRQNGQRDRVIFIVRPDELGLSNPIHVIPGPNPLWICEEFM